jgi:hypothetical protein
LPNNEWVEKTFQTTDESEIWVLTRATKQPWTMRGSLINITGSKSERAFYPKRVSVNAATGYGNEAISRYLGISSNIDPEPASMQEASLMAVPPGNRTIAVDFKQTSGDTGGIEIWVLRVWR